MIYDHFFFTKVNVVHTKRGYVLRFVSFSCILIALPLFHFLNKMIKKTSLEERYSNIGTTYTLLLGAISLEFVSLFNLIFSDWAVIKMSHKALRKTKIGDFIAWKLLKSSYHHSFCSTDHEEHSRQVLIRPLATPTLFRRWSESISGLSLITYCVRKRALQDSHKIPAEEKATKILWHRIRRIKNFICHKSTVLCKFDQAPSVSILLWEIIYLFFPQ